MNLGQKIRDLRKERGITLARLAGQLAISPSYLSAIERNLRRPSLQMLKKLGDRLNIPVNYLVSSEDNILTGKKLKYIRESRNLSLDDLSEICDIPLRTLEKIEEGLGSPDLECIKKLSQGLNVTIKYFLDVSVSHSLGTRLKKVRLSRRCTIKALAEEAGLPSELIIQIENGQTVPNLENLEAISASLNTSPAYLLMESKDVEELLTTFSKGLLELLEDPDIQAALRSLRDFHPEDIKHIINFIIFFKQNRSYI